MWLTLLLFLLKATYIVEVHADYTDPHCQNKQVIAELFEWKWTDVAAECERFLSKKGYCGVQVSPVAEHVLVTNDHMRPWWERYQPVSYDLTSRGGNETQLKDMVDRCNKVGVRIYVDVVINNMASLGRSGLGSAGNPFDADAYDFPAVPYKREHFNPRTKCSSSSGNVDNYGDPNNVRNCNVDGQTDLDQNLEFVRDRITGFLNKLVDIGVSGFRVDSAEHMWPADISAIQKRLKDLPDGGRPFFYHEVNEIIDRGIQPSEYYNLGYVSEYRYGKTIANSTVDFSSLNNILSLVGMVDPQNALVFVDSHLNQRTDGQIVTFKTPREYKMAQAFTLAFNYGLVRVMSSYFYTDISAGPPHEQDFTAKDVTIDANGTCGNGWVCEHRWKPIANMVAFRNAVAGTDVQHWYNSGNVVAFARGNKGFFVMSTSGQLTEQFKTELPAGEYCDIVHSCRQKVIVDSGGVVTINIDDTEEPMVAIFDDGSHSTTKGITTTMSTTSSSITVLSTTESNLPDTSTPIVTSTQSSSVPTTSMLSQTESNTNSAVTTLTPLATPVKDSSEPESTPSVSTIMSSTTSTSSSITITSTPMTSKTATIVMPPVSSTHVSATGSVIPTSANIKVVSGTSGIKMGQTSTVDVYYTPSNVPHNTLTDTPSSIISSTQGVSSSNSVTGTSPGAFAANNLSSIVNVQTTSTRRLSSAGSTATATLTTSSSILNTQGASVASSIANTNGSPSSAVTSQGFSATLPGSNTVSVPSISNTQGYSATFPVTDTQGSTLSSVLNTQDLGGTSPLVTIKVTSPSPSITQGITAATTQGLLSSQVERTQILSTTLSTVLSSTSTITASSSGPTTASWQRTVIFLQKLTRNGEDVFIKGGIDHDQRSGCSTLVSPNPCELPIRHRPLGTGPHFTAYNAWSTGDNYLDWYGVEPGQGSFKGRPAEGTPALWTTNNPNKAEYNSLNSYGEHYWLVDVDMDCSKTVGGFFEFKGDVNGGWEGQVTGNTCSGTGSATPPYRSENHMARCGFINVFHWGTGSCEIHPFSTPTTTAQMLTSTTPETLTTRLRSSTAPFIINPSSTGMALTGSSLSTGSTTQNSETTTTSPWLRTVILLEFRTRSGQDVFLKGGMDHAHRTGCSNHVFSDPCAIPIKHRPLGTGPHYTAYNSWSSGDNYLDWYGAELGQGSFKGRPAEGTPTLWTTNNPNKPEYSSLNSYGEHYWLMDVDMDCSKTVGGFFEFKGDVNGGWEGQVTGNTCSGTGSITPPYQSENHMARCGFINVFHWGTGSCEIHPF